ncbi:peroxynitrite isomerase THAP4 isoform X1 [Pleurodeles waltl]|uniref:peroxynitrite isomerase THAP4 isoform X1 n=1 Tax=Pleurodeles waltl TaxID=8319 RepID=UPI003709A003
MVICCAAVNCSNRQGQGIRGSVSFHRFPLKDSKRLSLWLKAVQRSNWIPTKYSFLCSEHFGQECFSRRLEDQHRLLKATAVPSIFQCPRKRKSTCVYARRRRKLETPEVEVFDEVQSDQQGVFVSGCELMRGEKDMQNLLTCRDNVDIGFMKIKNSQVQIEGIPGHPSLGKNGAAMKLSQSPIESSSQMDINIESWVTDTSGISIDDFSPPVSGACKFIDSLHSYSFSSRHSRERLPLTRETPERKRIKREVGLSGGGKVSMDSAPPSALSATSQDQPESPSAPPTDPAPWLATEASPWEKGEANPSQISVSEAIASASGTCKQIDWLHTYCFSSKQSKSQVCCLREQVDKKNGELKSLRQRASRSDGRIKKLRQKLAELKRLSMPQRSSLRARDSEAPPLNPAVQPLAWMLGSWVAEPPGNGTFPTICPFRYLEEVQISHVGQPVLNFTFNAFHPDSRKPLHRECGFIRLQPDTNRVAFISAQNTGIVEVEEGELNGQELTIASHSIARMSFAKEPHVEQITRKFCLNAEGKLEQTVSMATSTQPLTQHLHITYRKVDP